MNTHNVIPPATQSTQGRLQAEGAHQHQGDDKGEPMRKDPQVRRKQPVVLPQIACDRLVNVICVNRLASRELVSFKLEGAAIDGDPSGVYK